MTVSLTARFAAVGSSRGQSGMANLPAIAPHVLGHGRALGAVLDVDAQHAERDGGHVGGRDAWLRETAVVPAAAAVPRLLLDAVVLAAVVEADAELGAAVAAPRRDAQRRPYDLAGEVQRACVPALAVPGLLEDVEVLVLGVDAARCVSDFLIFRFPWMMIALLMQVGCLGLTGCASARCPRS